MNLNNRDRWSRRARRLFGVFVVGMLLTIFAPNLAHVAGASADYDVYVHSGTPAGVSTGLQLADDGKRVALSEETSHLGGQMGPGGVSSMDDGYVWNPLSQIEAPNGIYSEYLNDSNARIGGHQNAGTCYYMSASNCFRPSDTEAALMGMVQKRRSQGRTFDTYFLSTLQSLTFNGSFYTVTLRNLDGSTRSFTATEVAEADEYGDALPLVGAQYYIGGSLSPNINLSAPIQSITYTFTLKYYSGGVPSNLLMPADPPGYADYVGKFQAMMAGHGNCQDGNGANPKTFEGMICYRGMPDPRTYGANAQDGSASRIWRTSMNFINDQPETARFVEDVSYRTARICDARLQSLNALAYWMKNMPGWAIADDEVNPNDPYVSAHLCGNIPVQFQTIERLMSETVYNRQTRQIVGKQSLTSDQIVAQKRTNRFDPSSVLLVNDATSIGIPGYDLDIHGNVAYQAGRDNPADNGAGHGGFGVPLWALIPVATPNFVVVTGIDDGVIGYGATRTQPSEFLLGQAGGALLSVALDNHVQPGEVPAAAVQLKLARANDRVALQEWYDVSRTTFGWAGIQVAAVNKLMNGNGGNFSPNDAILRGDTAVVLARLFAIPFDGTQDGAIAQLQARGMARGSDFAPGNRLTKDQLSFFLSRGFGQNYDSAVQAAQWLQTVGVEVGCVDSGCITQEVPRWQMALAAAEALVKIKVEHVPPPPVQVPGQPSVSAGVAFAAWFDYVTPTGYAVGWACDTNGGPVTVDAYLDGNGFGRQIAHVEPSYVGDDSPAIAQICAGNGARRFLIPIPDDVRGTGVHKIYLYVVGGGKYQRLDNNGWDGNPGTAFSLGAKLPFGFVDYVDTQGRLWGWACDPRDFTRALEIRVNGLSGSGEVQVAVGTAATPDEYAVGYFCNGQKAHRFIIQLPASALSYQYLRVYAVGVGGEALPLIHPDYENVRVSTTDRHDPPAGR